MLDLFKKVRFLKERKMEKFFQKVPNFFYVPLAELLQKPRKVQLSNFRNDFSQVTVQFQDSVAKAGLFFPGLCLKPGLPCS